MNQRPVILTHGYFLAEDPKEQQIMRPYPPLGILYISAFLKQAGRSVAIIDSTFLRTADWKTRILETKPGIVGFYTNLMTKLRVLELNNWLKTEFPDCITFVGGPDVTYNIENYLNAGFDYTISGEGENTVLELTDALRNNTSISEIQGVGWKNDAGTVITNEARTKIRELDTLPFPDRASIPMERYLEVWKTHHGKRTVNISTQRGCPYTCKWCSTAVYGQSYRRNTPEQVVNEILHLQSEFGVEALWFVDDVFTVSHKWIAELHALFLKHNLRIDFECITRAERLNETVLQQLREMGCFRIWIGAESGSQRIIERMDRRVELETVQQTMQQTRKMGMEAGTFIMVGYPGEELQDIVQTMQHIRSCNPHLLTITQAYPIKGTGLYTEIENDILTHHSWLTSTDRDIRFRLPYSDKFYHYAIRYLVNGWLAHRDNSLKHRIKHTLALLAMKLTR